MALATAPATMRPLLFEVSTAHTPESLSRRLRGEPGLVLLRSFLFEARARYSLVAVRPFLTLQSRASRCEITTATGEIRVQFGNPWRVMDSLMSRYELLDEVDLPFPLGGCFGYWGYELKHFVERLGRRAIDDLESPDCHLGFYDSLVVFDHLLGKTWIVSTGLQADGSRDEQAATLAQQRWRRVLDTPQTEPAFSAWRSPIPNSPAVACRAEAGRRRATSTFTREAFVRAVERALRYIRAGDIYQVNLAQRLAAPAFEGWDFCERLNVVSPAPFSAFLECGGFQIASSSPELFLRMSGGHIVTRPIKGTRPRSADPTRDAQLTYELQTSAKEMAELVMITDLLRNDLGRVCEFGSVQVPELVRLERYPQVQHLVSTVEGRLRQGVTHFEALAQCFPGGSVTGAPKIRAMEIIDELEPVTRGPYTGCIGYLGFNRESQLSIAIRTAVCRAEGVYFHAGAGIVADSVPDAEYEETLAKAAGFVAAADATLDGQGKESVPTAFGMR